MGNLEGWIFTSCGRPGSTNLEEWKVRPCHMSQKTREVQILRSGKFDLAT